MGERSIVEVGQEARRRRRVRIGQDTVGDVEQVVAALVAEAAQLRPQALDRDAHPVNPDHGLTSATVAGP